jgi:hypothetical protein
MTFGGRKALLVFGDETGENEDEKEASVERR